MTTAVIDEDPQAGQDDDGRIEDKTPWPPQVPLRLGSIGQADEHEHRGDVGSPAEACHNKRMV